MSLLQRLKNLSQLSKAEISVNYQNEVKLKAPKVEKPKGQATIVEMDNADMFKQDGE